MSRNGWRLSRALRVLLACLALWLPAPSATTSFVPVDAVVMIAGGAAERAPGSGAADAEIADARGRSNGRRADETAGSARMRGPDRLAQLSRSTRNRSETRASRTAPPPLYLLHCALLR